MPRYIQTDLVLYGIRGSKWNGLIIIIYIYHTVIFYFLLFFWLRTGRSCHILNLHCKRPMVAFYLEIVLKLYIKNKQTKRQHKKIVCETVNFGSLNLIILKKKFKNTTKYYNIFTIPSFLGSKEIYFILFERNATSIIFLEQILNDKLLLVLNWAHNWYHFFIHQKYLAT